MRVGAKYDARRIGQAKRARNMRLRLGGDRREYLLRLVIEQSRRVTPGLFLRGECDIGPGMMAVRRDVVRRTGRTDAQRKTVYCGDTGPALMSGSFKWHAF